MAAKELMLVLALTSSVGDQLAECQLERTLNLHGLLEWERRAVVCNKKLEVSRKRVQVLEEPVVVEKVDDGDWLRDLGLVVLGVVGGGLAGFGIAKVL